MAKTSSTPIVALNPQVQRTREALRQGLLSALAEKPLDQITHQELAAHAKVGYATFFRHYESKEALLREIVGQQVVRVLEQTSPAMDQDALEGCLVLCRYVDDNRAVWATLLKASPDLVREEFARAALKNLPKRGRGQTWVSVELGTRIGVAATIELLRWWMEEPKGLTAQGVAKVLHRMVVGPALSGMAR